MKVYDKHKDIKEKLSKADVVVDSPCMLTCGRGLKATTHLHINREKEKTTKEMKRENKLYT